MTPRRAGELTLQLPPGSRIWAELGYDSAWSNAEHLQANILDALRGANWQRGGSQGKEPEPIDRPSQIKAHADQNANREEARVNRARRFRDRARAAAQANK